MRPLKDIIKELRENHGNKSEVARKLGISPQRLGQYEKGKMEPKSDFYEKWEGVFGEDIRAIQKGGAIETNVSHGTINHTSVHKRSDNKEKALRGDIYEEMFEKFLGSNSQYIFIHREMLNSHRMVAIEQFEKDKVQTVQRQTEFDSKQKVIDDHQKTIDDLLDRYDKLVLMYTTDLKAKPQGIEKSKKNP